MIKENILEDILFELIELFIGKDEKIETQCIDTFGLKSDSPKLKF